ncbi:hypothetical protein [Agromyces aerolatus]|uniref:hypothetical protein n=1 Tax=Agromyces sp. LY-1074 TaxID=3074080 RepID=UPI0028545F4A|nr:MULTISPECIES: hypothetical protein [unclassified Agromyces]MDR5701499.1 hypothetical protein [Agromyces sp. LY-1074]MDR5704434.1 hypothetical protein [Agromyces sp. LY-1358]
MQSGGRLPDDQAEIVFTDAFFEYLAGLTASESVAVLADVVALTSNPVGKHPLSNTTRYGQLAGFNTAEVLGGEHRIVYRVRVVEDVGVIEVVVGGPRRGSEVYTAAHALVASGVLTVEEATQIWDALNLLDVAAEHAGLDGWDYQPEPADPGHRRAAVAAGVLPADIADLLSKDELAAAMANGWGDSGADPTRAIEAALRRARGNAVSSDIVLTSRLKPRCGAYMPRAKKSCIRCEHHPGAHRSMV